MTYQEQLDHLRRRYQRLQELNKGLQSKENRDYYGDEFPDFFIHCHHLKDWIKNDGQLPISVRDKVESFIDENECMQICADICNVLKHAERRSLLGRSAKYPLLSRSPSLPIKIVRVGSTGSPEVTIQVKLFIETVDGDIDAFELATQCLQKWHQFIQKNIGSSGGLAGLVERRND